MATIRAAWRRVISVKPYETETFELGVEVDEEAVSSDEDLAQGAAELYRQLAAQGDQLILERYGRGGQPQERQAPEDLGPRSRPGNPRPIAPDPYTR